ncbi:MAG TPA: methyltransferase domain-containing protein [Candidatus Methylomirabilis sp.]|nr:methyltransferase domain-containing protein [Candidatus Methylomirabilis sp.]
MTTIIEHYENHLARYYSWLFGDFNKTVELNRRFFIAHDIIPGESKIALDLGCGPGFQSIALAQLGFRVYALDFSQKLLDELRKHSASMQIDPIRDDILNFASHCPENVELSVCMGDTLTHLDSFEKVKDLFEDVYGSLETGGKFLLTFRDMVHELKGTDRFIPVKSDLETIFTCILEYEADHVKVNDMIYTKSEDGWKLDVSCYRKLRIPLEWAKKELLELGFSICLCDNNKGMITVIAGK